MLAPDLFGLNQPPFVALTIQRLDPSDLDRRLVTLTVSGHGHRPLVANEYVSRYSPEATVFRAVAATLEAMETAQGQLTSGVMAGVMQAAFLQHVDPF